MVYGLLLCDVFSEEPSLRYFPLPEGLMNDDDEMGSPSLAELLKRRCIAISGGGLRYIEIDSSGIWITVWTMDDKDGPHWEKTFLYELGLLWTDKCFEEAGLKPNIVPSLAAIHPTDCNIIYMVQNATIFSVSLGATASRIAQLQKFVLDENDITPSQYLFIGDLGFTSLPSRRDINIKWFEEVITWLSTEEIIQRGHGMAC
ncbi:hypothetical protein E2562_032475 [Oryza meyeriana var. granulata]|uniref:DUF1618 domain-containing protein n=1 Tax=Oryza meyeriana var. granulata TaxID=110450 RepID=A0A6G1ERZ0_9ORYZ|nr:hypothetical protein E2562_032475 [Oryza meyeriana var. granulata]